MLSMVAIEYIASPKITFMRNASHMYNTARGTAECADPRASEPPARLRPKKPINMVDATIPPQLLRLLIE